MVNYHPNMSKELEENIEMATLLYAAIEQERIDIYFQEVVDVITNQVVYVEALARWKEEGIGLIPPDRFFALAAESNIIDFLDQYLIKKALQQFKRWQANHMAPLKLSMNLSPSTLFYEGFEQVLFNQTKEHQLEPNQICLEISENTFVRNTELCIERIKNLKQMGFCIAIDDFGSKYSSLSILDVVPYDVLKLDGVFAMNIQSTTIQELASALIKVNQQANKHIIIERIETKEQSQKFLELGCYLQQGYYHHKPQPPIDRND